MFPETIFHKLYGGEIIGTFSFYCFRMLTYFNGNIFPHQKLEKRGGVQGDESIGEAIIQA